MAKGATTTQKDNSTQQVQLPEWMSEAGQTLFNKAMSDSAANPVKAYAGQPTAPMSGNQKAAESQAKSTANTGQSQIAAGTAAVQSGLGTGDRVSADNFDNAAAGRYMSPYLGAVQERTVGDIMRNGAMQLEDLGDSAAANHAYGGTRQAVAQAEATKGINNNILNYLASSNQAGYENAQQQFNTDADRQLQAGTTNAGLDQSELDRAIAGGSALGNLGQQASGINAESIMNLLKTGGVAQDTANAAAAAKYNEFLRMQDAQVNRDEDLMSILAGTPRNVTTTAHGTTSQTSNPGWLSTALGAGQIAASFYSDERLKENVEPVGEMADGLPVVDFNYRPNLGLPSGRFRGVLAQDVARVRPSSLGPKVDGFATVDASLAPQLVGGSNG
jgi:hypothetical protein